MSDWKEDIHALLLKRIPFVSEIDEKMACIVTHFGAIFVFVFSMRPQFSFVSSTARQMFVSIFRAEPTCGSYM